MNSADTADQMTKMTLEGIQVAAEIALKAGGATAKSLAATLYAIITDNKKIKGKTRLNALLKFGKELKVFAIHHNDLKKFCDAAKQYGVLYSVLKEKNRKKVTRTPTISRPSVKKELNRIKQINQRRNHRSNLLSSAKRKRDSYG